MHRHELVKRFDIKDIMRAMASIDEFERSYDDCLQRILSDIKSRLESCTGIDLLLLNDIADYGTISEEKAYVLGVCEGIRLVQESDQD